MATKFEAEQGDASDASTSERILREAAILFRARGFASTTMRNIAAATGLTPGALYWHFPSKEAILYDIMLALSDDWHAELARIAEGPSPTEKLRAFARTQVAWELRLADEATLFSPPTVPTSSSSF